MIILGSSVVLLLIAYIHEKWMESYNFKLSF